MIRFKSYNSVPWAFEMPVITSQGREQMQTFVVSAVMNDVSTT